MGVSMEDKFERGIGVKTTISQQFERINLPLHWIWESLFPFLSLSLTHAQRGNEEKWNFVGLVQIILMDTEKEFTCLIVWIVFLFFFVGVHLYFWAGYRWTYLFGPFGVKTFTINAHAICIIIFIYSLKR